MKTEKPRLMSLGFVVTDPISDVLPESCDRVCHDHGCRGVRDHRKTCCVLLPCLCRHLCGHASCHDRTWRKTCRACHHDHGRGAVSEQSPLAGIPLEELLQLALELLQPPALEQHIQQPLEDTR